MLVAATFLMASSFVAGKILLTAVPPFPLIGWRFLLAAAATLPLALVAGRREGTGARATALPTTMNSLLATLSVGVLQTAAVMGLMFWALQTITAGEAAILLFTNPIWVAALAPIFLAERLSVVRIVGLILGIVGVALALGAHSLSALQGDLLVLLASLAWAASTVITKRLHAGMNPWWLNFWQMLVGALVLLAAAALLHQSWPGHLSPLNWAWFLWLAIPGSTFSFGLWFTALRQGGAATTSSYLFLVPLFSVLLAHLILHERFLLVQLLGGILIGLALYLVNGTRLSKERAEDDLEAVEQVG